MKTSTEAKSCIVKSKDVDKSFGGLFFLDSGAHSIYNKYVRTDGRAKHIVGYKYYDTPEFWEYVDGYANFVKKYADVIDLYATVDAIFNPEKSWEVLKYLEQEHGLCPVPVIHYGSALSWIDRHLEAGYELLGIGGLGQEATAAAYRAWADGVFSRLCLKDNGFLPLVRTHGFAMTAYELLIRYPWWSVDSATWAKVAAFGGIMVPHKRSGKYTFDRQPYIIPISHDAPSRSIHGKHFLTLTKKEQSIVLGWLEEIGCKLGKVDANGEVIEHGVCTRHTERKEANLLFFERLRDWLPAYPWPFKAAKVRDGLW